MPSSQGPGTARGMSKPTLKELEHIRGEHLQISFNRDKNLVELVYVCDCKGKDACTVPHTNVVFYVCPTRPCPPGL